MPITHVAWDEGTIDAAITAVLGFCVPPKTTKTLCGRRVTPGQIDNKNPSCGLCSYIWIRDEVAADELIEEIRGMKK